MPKLFPWQFSFSISFNPHKNPGKCVSLFSFSGEEIHIRICVARVPQLVSDGTEINPGLSDAKSHALNPGADEAN